MKARKSVVIFAAAVLMASSSVAFAATSGSITLSGSVAAILEISVTGAPAASALPITTTVTDLPIATVVERSNKKAGYTVTLQSSSALSTGSTNPALVSTESVDKLPYTIKYDGNAVNFSSGSAIVSDVSSRTGASGSSKVVTVSFSGANYFLNESTYADTLTFTIAVK